MPIKINYHLIDVIKEYAIILADATKRKYHHINRCNKERYHLIIDANKRKYQY
jgi:hypothetical protein